MKKNNLKEKKSQTLLGLTSYANEFEPFNFFCGR